MESLVVYQQCCLKHSNEDTSIFKKRELDSKILKYRYVSHLK